MKTLSLTLILPDSIFLPNAQSPKLWPLENISRTGIQRRRCPFKTLANFLIISSKDSFPAYQGAHSLINCSDEIQVRTFQC